MIAASAVEDGSAFVQPSEKQNWGGGLAFAPDRELSVITLVD